jgi:hypothetical protein
MRPWFRNLPRGSKETVGHSAFSIKAGDLPRGVDACGGGFVRSGHIKCRDRAGTI